MTIVLDPFAMGIPKNEKLVEASKHRISKSKQESIEKISASLRKTGLKLTFKVLVNETIERGETYLEDLECRAVLKSSTASTLIL